MSKTVHVSVLLNEILEGLHLDRGAPVVDATLGGGGHTKAILEKFPDAEVLAIKGRVATYLKQEKRPLGVEEIARGVQQPDAIETIFKVLRHLAANQRLEIVKGASLFEDQYVLS